MSQLPNLASDIAKAHQRTRELMQRLAQSAQSPVTGGEIGSLAFEMLKTLEIVGGIYQYLNDNRADAPKESKP
jgi:hypothetical protein